MEGERACVPCAGCKDKGILMASTRKGKKMHSLRPNTQKVLFFLPSQFSVVCPNGFSFFFLVLPFSKNGRDFAKTIKPDVIKPLQ